MSWSKLEDKSKKPLGWWRHKVLCELGWALRNNILLSNWAWSYYYKHLNLMCAKYGINVYGERIGKF
jgi:hypothetical protein